MELAPLSYSLVIMLKDKIYGVRDPYGNRPLCIGKVVPVDSGYSKCELMFFFLLLSKTSMFIIIFVYRSQNQWRRFLPKAGWYPVKVAVFYRSVLVMCER